MPDPQRWDVSASMSFLSAKPGASDDGRYQDDWYQQERYAVAVGRYWNAHLKTEVEYARSGEGSLFRETPRGPTGFPDYPYFFESYHRLEQASVRIVWQFGENNWVHPYVGGGLVVDRERQHVAVASPVIEYRAGITGTAGAKIYLSRNTFFNAGVIGTYSKPAATLSFLGGFGLDF